MIIGLGIDLAEVSRVREAIERHGERLMNRVFTPGEVAYCSDGANKYERFAARFAAKEAAMKALGTGWRNGITWHDFEVVRSELGKPAVKLTGKGLELFHALGGKTMLLSMTHTRDYAFAEVIIEGASPETESSEIS